MAWPLATTAVPICGTAHQRLDGGRHSCGAQLARMDCAWIVHGLRMAWPLVAEAPPVRGRDIAWGLPLGVDCRDAIFAFLCIKRAEYAAAELVTVKCILTIIFDE